MRHKWIAPVFTGVVVAVLLLPSTAQAGIYEAESSTSAAVVVNATPWPSAYGSLSGIAAALCGNPAAWRQIARASGISNPRLLQIGQRVVVPCARSAGAAGGAGGAGAAPSGSGWVSPLSSYRLTSCFAMRRLASESYSRMHYGLDMAAPGGTPIRAASGGVVLEVDAHRGYGISVTLSHGNNVRSFYAHMSSRAVSRGQRVVAGQRIGRVGNTGYSFGNHLHFGMHYGPGSGYRDSNPAPFLRSHGVKVAC